MGVLGGVGMGWRASVGVLVGVGVPLGGGISLVCVGMRCCVVGVFWISINNPLVI